MRNGSSCSWSSCSLDDGLPLCHADVGLDPAPKKPPAYRQLPRRTTSRNRRTKLAEAPSARRTTPHRLSAKARNRPRRGGGGPDGPPRQPEVELVDESELVLGSVTDKSATAAIASRSSSSQKGAGVESVSSSRFDAEFENGQARQAAARIDRRESVRGLPRWRLTVSEGDRSGTARSGGDSTGDDCGCPRRRRGRGRGLAGFGPLGGRPRRQGRIRRPVSMIDPVTRSAVDGRGHRLPDQGAHPEWS